MPLMFIMQLRLSSWDRACFQSLFLHFTSFYRIGYGRVRTSYTADDASWKERGARMNNFRNSVFLGVFISIITYEMIIDRKN